MLSWLMTVPKSPTEWSIWSLSHRDQHALIRQAIHEQYGVDLIEYPLDPIPPDDIAQWQEWNQQSHNDFNAVLGTQSGELEDVDFKDPTQLAAWIYAHRREHETAAAVLKI